MTGSIRPPGFARIASIMLVAHSGFGRRLRGGNLNNGWFTKGVPLYVVREKYRQPIVRKSIVRRSAPCLSFHNVNGAFPNIGTLASVDFSYCTNRIRTLVNRGNTKGSALLGVLDNGCTPAANSMIVGKRRVSFSSAATTLGTNITVVCRRLRLIPRVAITRGVCLNRLPRGNNVIGHSLLGCRTNLRLGRLNVSVSPSAPLGCLSVNR